MQQCEQCGKQFSKPALLKRHQVVHTKVKPFACPNCSSSYTQMSSLLRHQLKTHASPVPLDTGPLTCSVAQEALAALRNLQSGLKQQQAVSSIGSQSTLEVQPMVSQLVGLKDKLNPTHEAKIVLTQRIQRSGRGKCYYVCEFCSKEFLKSYDLIRHRRSHTKEKPYTCRQCLKNFTTQNKLNEHQNRLHSGKKSLRKPHAQKDQSLEQLKAIVPPPLVISRSYKCVYCEQTFKRKFNCRSHMLSHLKKLLNGPVTDAPKRTHNCLQCHKTFQRSNDLSRHLLTHSKVKSNVCHLCQQAFSLKSTLSRHMLTHQSTRQLLYCQVCGKSFQSQTSLNLHLRLHTGERPFSCEICSQTFRTSGHRLEHMRAERHQSKLSL